MNLLRIMTFTFAAGALAACSSTAVPTTPFVPLVSGSATANADGTYTITQSGTTITLSVPSTTPAASALGLRYWNDPSAAGYVYDGADVTAVAIMNPTSFATLAGLSGTAASSVPTSGSAAYTGAFSATYFRGGVVNLPWLVRGAMTTNVDFGSGTLSGTATGNDSSSLTVYGVISGTQFNGLAAFSGLESTGSPAADLSGGFYGSNTLAGIFQNADVAGIIWGVSP